MRVRGTQNSVPYIEIGPTEIYIRTNVEHIETDEFTGWEYNEQIVPMTEYIAMLADTDSVNVMALIISQLMGEIDLLNARVAALEGAV